MPVEKNARYPYHLAKLVARDLTARGIDAPPEPVLLKLFETLYFASLKTDEARPCRCTVNYLDPAFAKQQQTDHSEPDGSMVVPFETPIAFDVRSLLKLADAADPNVSSIAVFCDDDERLMIWGLVDQELRYGDWVALDASEDPKRPGLFQANIAGVGNIAAYKNYDLIGALEQNQLIVDYHDVLWKGPVNARLKENLHQTLAARHPQETTFETVNLIEQVKEELLVRWHNAMCRMLFNIEQYGHGGGLLIAPQFPAADVNIKYATKYDRLPRTLIAMAQHQIAKRQLAGRIAALNLAPKDLIPYQFLTESLECEAELERLKGELLGCVHFIASSSCVDGFVLLDRSLVVHGFGVETRAENDITEVFLAGDAEGTPRLLRPVPLSQFGTRHRAMMRYCNEHEGALGFVISQDGDIRAVMKHQGQLILWENINVQLAYRAENQEALSGDYSSHSMAGMFENWMHSLSDLRSARA